MKPEDIKTLEQAERFVEGCLNDFELGIVSKSDTIKHFADYTIQIATLVEKKQLSCNYCNKSFIYLDDLQTHIFEDH